MTSPFKAPIQLVTNDRSTILLSRAHIQHETVHLFQFTRKPTQKVFVTPNFKIQGILGKGREQIIPSIQALQSAYIDNDRNLNEDQIFPDCLYAEVASLKTKRELLQIIKKWDFCIFPHQEDFPKLIEMYKKAGIQKIPIKYIYINTKPDKQIDLKTSEKYRKAIERVNTDFLWGKIKEFQNFVTQYTKGQQEENALLWLNKELELTSPILTTYDGSTWKGMRDGNKNETLENIIGMREIKTLKPIIGYRVYGHFALCCLEFLHDIENGLRVFSCHNCGKIRKREANNKRKFCTKKESAKCVLERQAKRQKKHRKTKK